jgi:hypothetical protein
VVLDVLERGIVGKVLENPADGFFRCTHGGTR